MNNKEFNALLAAKTSMTQKQTQQLLASAVALISQQLVEAQQVPLFQVGTMEVKQKEQRVIVNPTTNHRLLVPPKLVPQFKLSPTLKNKLK